MKLEGIKAKLLECGITLVQSADGDFSIAKRENKYDNESKAFGDSAADEIIDKNLMLRSQQDTLQFISVKERLSTKSARLAEMLTSMEQNVAQIDEIIEKLRQNPPQIANSPAKKSFWHAIYNKGVKKIEEKNKADYKESVRNHGNAISSKEAERARVSTAMYTGKQVANLNKMLLSIVSTMETEVNTIVNSMHNALVKHQEEAKAKAEEAKAKQSESNPNDSQPGTRNGVNVSIQ